jgi:hypothetical protein
MKTKLILGGVAALALGAGLVSAARVPAQTALRVTSSGVVSSNTLHQASDGDGEQVDSSEAAGAKADDAEGQDDAAQVANVSDGEAADAIETTAQ